LTTNTVQQNLYQFEKGVNKNSKKSELLTQLIQATRRIYLLKKACFIEKIAFQHLTTAVFIDFWEIKNRFLRFFGLIFSIKSAKNIVLLA
jgi:hypothetical protein